MDAFLNDPDTRRLLVYADGKDLQAVSDRRDTPPVCSTAPRPDLGA